MKHRLGTAIAAGLFLLVSLTPGWLQAQNLPRPIPPGLPGAPPPLPAAPQEPQDRGAPVERVAPGLYRMGEIGIDREKKSVSFPAVVNQERGLLEYLLVRTGGKTHESLLRTQVRPYDLQLALLLVGFEGSDRPLRFQGDPGKPKGDAVAIALTYTGPEGKPVTLAPEAWLVKRAGNRSLDVAPLDWVFTGSVIVNGRFMAQMDGSIIALYHDPVAMIDHATEGGESDKIWFVREGIPPAGTPVTLTIQGRR